MRDLVLGLDIGGGGVRCVALRAGTRAAAFVHRPWAKGAVYPLEGFGYGLDPDAVWEQIGPVIQAALVAAEATAADVAGIATASMRHSLVALDRGGTVLLGSPNLDARAIPQALALASEHGDRFHALTGRRPLPNMLGPKLSWMAETMRPAFEKIATVLTISDWVGYRMAGVARAELAQACESLLLDLRTRSWSAEARALMGISPEILPELIAAGTPLGVVTPGAAGELGLRAGTPVVAAGADTQTALLALGAVRPGDVALVGGTTAPLQRVLDRVLIDPRGRLWTGLHAVPGLFVLESNAGTMGKALAWMAAMLYAGHPAPVAALAADAERVEAGGGGVISTVGAGVFDASSLGLPVEHLSFSTTNRDIDGLDRARLARAMLEGMAFAVKANLDQMVEVTGVPCSRLVVGGGVGQSRVWTDAISQVTGLEVAVGATREVTAQGAAICAAAGVGLFEKLSEGARGMMRQVRVHTPEPAAQRLYSERYEEWMALQESRRDADLAAAEMLMPFQARAAPRSAQGRRREALRPRIHVAADFGAEALAALRQLGEVTYASYREGQVLAGQDLVEALAGVQVLITEVDLVDAEAVQQLPDLRLVVTCRGNPTNVDLCACTAAGIPVLNTPGRNADAVADLTVGLMLMLARKLPGAIGFLREPGGEVGDMGRMGQAYFSYQGQELWRKCVGVIGGGAVGRRVIQRLLPFGASLLVCDPFVSADQAVLMGARKVELDELLARSHFVTLHAPVTEATRGMLDDAAFARMCEGAFLVNTARAALVDTPALLRALASGKLGGVALDVFDVEPPGADDPLLAFETVIATPHIGGDTVEVGIHQGMIAVEGVRHMLRGEDPEHILNPETLARFSWTGPRSTRVEDLARLTHDQGPGVTDLDLAPKPVPGGEQKPGFLRRLLSGRREPVIGPARSESGTRAGGDGERAREAGGGDSTGAAYMRIVERFLDLLVRDEALAAGTAGKEVIFLYTLKELDRSFYMSFVNGVVEAGLGEPLCEPHVRLKMDAATFDGLMLGSVNGMQAAMAGKLSFSGDTRRAMSMQRFQRAMGGAYQQARAELGDPGDLTRIGAGSGGGVAAPAVITSAPQPEVTKTGDVRDEILQVVNDLYARGLITATGGNVSARSAENPAEIWITPSAIFKGDLRADMMVKVDLEGRQLSESVYAASSERYVHCAIYRSRPEITAVVHSHAPRATLMALTGVPFEPISSDAAFMGEIPAVPFIMPGVPGLGHAVAAALGQERLAALMQNHGLVVVGTSPRRAADMTETVERTAEALLACRMLGVAPQVLPADVVEELRGMGKLLA